jgi:deoxyadenosine/deoxycytidine kinase
MPPIIIYIEGNIGTGKSTFLKQLDDNTLKTKYNYDVIYEPVDEWQKVGVLEKFYSDPKKYCYLFQSYCLFTRFQLLQKLDDKLNYVFIERSIFSDKYVFANGCRKLGQLEDIEYNIYNKWFDEFLLKHPLNYHHIYLQVDPKICLERINQRNRGEESGITLEYLTLLHNQHEIWWLGGGDSNSTLTNDKFIKVYNNTNRLIGEKVIQDINLFLKTTSSSDKPNSSCGNTIHSSRSWV